MASALRNAEPAGTALTKEDPYHLSAVFMRETAASEGTYFKIIGGDGVERTLTQLPGELNGISGRYEYIVHQGKLTHQMFVRHGTINGVPITK